MCAICIVWSRHLVPTDSLIDTTLHLVFLECICVLVIIKSSIYMNCCCHLWLNTGLECGNWGSFAIFFFNVTVYVFMRCFFLSLIDNRKMDDFLLFHIDIGERDPKFFIDEQSCPLFMVFLDKIVTSPTVIVFIYQFGFWAAALSNCWVMFCWCFFG